LCGGQDDAEAESLGYSDTKRGSSSVRPEMRSISAELNSAGAFYDTVEDFEAEADVGYGDAFVVAVHAALVFGGD
jgi:hypothetical protein